MHTHTHAYGFDSLDYTVYGLYNPTRIEKLKLCTGKGDTHLKE